MTKKKITICLLAFLARGHMVTAGLMGELDRTTQLASAKPNVPSVEVSMVTVDPTEIRVRRTESEKSASATVTVQLFHQSLTSEQTVVLQVGTAKTDPAVPEVAVTYDPPNQTVRLPTGEAGRVNAEVKVLNPQLGSNPEATVVITATLSDPSPGIRIENNNPSAPNHQAALKILAR